MMPLRALPCCLLIVLFACGERRTPGGGPDDDTPPGIRTVQGLPGEVCGDDALMVVVTRADSTRFCIDRFEAGVDGESLGNAHQADDVDTENTLDGSTQASAQVALGVVPRAELSFYQAKAACANAGKRLCNVADWERACRGPDSLLYPYGDAIDDDACQGFFNYPDAKPSVTGSLKTCGSDFGVYDLSGNLEEWTDTAVERIPGSGNLDDRAVRGGSFKSNSHALSCVGPEFHAAPGSSDIDRGFRCCSDAP